MRRTTLAILPIFALMACATTTLSPSAQLTAAKSETLFEGAISLAINAFNAVEPSLSPAAKATGKAYVAKLNGIELAAQNAEAASDATTLAAQFTAGAAVYGDLKSIIDPASSTPLPAFPAALPTQ